jgi:hypothetical protein
MITTSACTAASATVGDLSDRCVAKFPGGLLDGLLRFLGFLRLLSHREFPHPSILSETSMLFKQKLNAFSARRPHHPALPEEKSDGLSPALPWPFSFKQRLYLDEALEADGTTGTRRPIAAKPWHCSR